MSARQRWLAPHLWWWAAVVAGVSYCVPAWSGWHGPLFIVWKGAGVGLLAVAAALSALAAHPHSSSTAGTPASLKQRQHSLAFNDARLLTAVMACGALGDVLLDAISLVAGAAWFALAHLLAMGAVLAQPAHGRRSQPKRRAYALVAVLVGRARGIGYYGCAGAGGTSGGRCRRLHLARGLDGSIRLAQPLFTPARGAGCVPVFGERPAHLHPHRRPRATTRGGRPAGVAPVFRGAGAHRAWRYIARRPSVTGRRAARQPGNKPPTKPSNSA